MTKEVTPDDIKRQLAVVEAALTRARDEFPELQVMLSKYAKQIGIGFIGAAGVAALSGSASASIGSACIDVADLHEAVADLAPEGFIQPFGAGDK